MGDTEHTDKGPIVEPMNSGIQVSTRMIVAGITLIVAVIFIMQNTDEVPIELLWFDIEWPLWLVMTVMLIAGALIGQGIVYARARNKKKAAAEAAKKTGKK